MCIQAAVNYFQRRARDKRHWEHLKVSSIRRVVTRLRNGEVAPLYSWPDPSVERTRVPAHFLAELVKLVRAADDRKAAHGILTK